MNDNLEHLMYQAGLTAQGCWDEMDSYMHDAIKQFAELIVRECVSTLNELHMWQSVNNQNYPSAWHDAVDNGIETIKEHFGVEE